MTSIQEAADATAKLLNQLQDDNARLKMHNSDLQNQVQNLTDSYVRLQEAAGRALCERDYYMRECAELTGKFTTFAAMAREALDTHRMAPFRPNGSAPKDEPANEEGAKAIAEAIGVDNGEAIPAFLSKPNQDSMKIEGPLKLKRRIVP